MATEVALHVFGNGTGESIVVDTLAGTGLIDCFRNGATVPALEFLRRRGCTRLEFLALTHPHDDHYGGIFEVVKYFTEADGIGVFWRYPVLNATLVGTLLKYRYSSLPARQAELQGLIDSFLLASKHRIPLRLCSVGLHLLRDEAKYGLEIEAVAPNSDYVGEADRVLLKRLREDGAVGAKEKNWPLNRLSSAFLLRIGSLRAVLGGDVPRQGWVLARQDSGFPADMGAQFLKACHHGSAVDNTPGSLDDILSGARGELAVVTRYTSSRLPAFKGMEALRGKFPNVVTLGQKKASPSRPLPTLQRAKPRGQYSVEYITVKLSSSGIAFEGPYEFLP